jgi:hypothetical protein
MSRLLLVLLLAALGCGNRQKTDASDASTPAGEQPTPRLQRTPPPDAGGPAAQAARDPQRPGTESPAQGPSLPGKPVPGLRNVLVPPTTPGAAQVALEGCLAQADATEESGARFPATAPTRAPSKPAVSVEALGGGVLVVHELAHGCCLQGDVTSSLEGRTVTVTETLSGKSCRCRCRSTMRAAVGLPPGDYTLKVVTNESGNRQIAHEAALHVR